MYVSVTRVSTGDQPIENAAIVGEEMLKWLRDMEGFEGLLMLCREGTTLAITFWVSRDVAEEHLPARMRFIDGVTSVADVRVEEIVPYEVAFAHLSPPVTDFTLTRDL